MSLNDMPIITIVIPVHNRESLLPETLNSVQMQTFTDWECIIVDDHSQDKSFDVAARYAKKDSRFIAVRLPDNKRFPSAARNYGLSLSRGDYVSFLDSDDLFLPEKLKLQIEEFERDKSLDMVTCRHSIFQDDCRSEIRKLKFAGKPYWLDVVWYQNYDGRYGGLWCANSPLWKKSALELIGAWDEELTDWEDVEISIRAILANLNISRVEKSLVMVREGKYQKLSATTRTLGFDARQKALLKSWDWLSNKGEVTTLRQKMISLKFFDITRSHINRKGLIKGIGYWISISIICRLNIIRISQGLLLLMSYRIKNKNNKLRRLLQTSFHKHLMQIPDAATD